MDATTRACQEKMGSIRADLIRIKGKLSDLARVDPAADFTDFAIEADVMLRSAENYMGDCAEEGQGSCIHGREYRLACYMAELHAELWMPEAAADPEEAAKEA